MIIALINLDYFYETFAGKLFPNEESEHKAAQLVIPTHGIILTVAQRYKFKIRRHHA
tara:strand:- start:171 stop:341 length:171 start_codon:yes stop_codon:yes gene_type:complete